MFIGRIDLFAHAAVGRHLAIWSTEEGATLVGARLKLDHGQSIFAARYEGDLAPPGFYDVLGRSMSGALRARPVSRCRITFRFGVRFDQSSGERDWHRGIDYGVPRGTPVMSVARGRVADIGHSEASGNFVEVGYDDGFESFYLHLDAVVPTLHVGDVVDQGQHIADSGNTGHSTGPHLHYELHLAGIPVDPLALLLPNVVLGPLTRREHLAFMKNLEACMIEEQTSKTNIPELARELLHLPFEQVAPSETNPRLSVGRHAFEELKKSILVNGLLQPIVVRPGGDVYEIIGGHRRFQANQELSAEHSRDKRFTRVSVVIVDADAATVPVLQLAENLNRSDLSAVEIADGVARAVASGVKAAQLAERLGWTKRNLNRYLQRLNAPDWFRDLANEVKVARKKLDAAGAVVIDDMTNKPAIETERSRGCRSRTSPSCSRSITSSAELTRFSSKRSAASSSARRRRSSRSGSRWRARPRGSKRKLRDEIRCANDPRPRPAEAHEAIKTRPLAIITADKCVIDLGQAATASTSARSELAAQLTCALSVFAFKSCVIVP